MDLQMEVYPAVPLSRMLSHFVQDDYVPIFLSERTVFFLVLYMQCDKGAPMTACTLWQDEHLSAHIRSVTVAPACWFSDLTLARLFLQGLLFEFFFALCLPV